MARKTALVCDVCKKPTNRIVAKLHYIPLIPGANRATHSNYTHHLDVGECCSSKLMHSFNFRKRQTARQYAAARRNGE